MSDKDFERFMKFVEVDGDCWVWWGSHTHNGYAQFRFQGSAKYAHRLSYEYFIGPIPDGLQLDHVKERCDNRDCVNPDHLEPVTHRENLLRGNGFGGINARKTYCAKGHPYSGYNLSFTPEGHRRCRTCDRDKAYRRFKQAQKEKSWH
ncbi:MAG: HNH endonuclease [Nitrospira sp.]|nr:HNH endonuclease [Nitrospira sp.]